MLLFLPKSIFYILFMPLPGLYPLGGKLGRILASAENLALLALSLVALLGLLRGPRSPAALSLLAFFCLILPPSALLEFDLGSATRHRLLFFPFILPFAAWQLSRWSETWQRPKDPKSSAS